MLVCMWFILLLMEMHMYVFVHVYGCLYILVFVLVYEDVCVSAYLFACAYRRVTVTQSSARPPAGSASPSSVLSGRHVSGWAVPTERNLCLVWHVNLAFRTRAPRTTSSPPFSMLQLVHVLFLWCVGVQVVDVGMYACGAACYA